jgi:hypothetical protein
MLEGEDATCSISTRANEVRELVRITDFVQILDEKCLHVVADQIPVALLSVKPDRDAAYLPLGGGVRLTATWRRQ